MVVMPTPQLTCDVFRRIISGWCDEIRRTGYILNLRKLDAPRFGAVSIAEILGFWSDEMRRTIWGEMGNSFPIEPDCSLRTRRRERCMHDTHTQLGLASHARAS